MAEQNPRISFTFPYRWLTENRDFFGENIERSITHDVGKDGLRILESVLSYRVEIFYENEKPIPIPLTKPQTQTLLKNMLPNARCLSIDTTYAQARDRDSLPLMDFRIYFDPTRARTMENGVIKIFNIPKQAEVFDANRERDEIDPMPRVSEEDMRHKRDKAFGV